jgi:integrase
MTIKRFLRASPHSIIGATQKRHCDFFAVFCTLSVTCRISDMSHVVPFPADFKHPGDKKGNNVYCELPPEALAIIQSMPHETPEIFPYSTDAISTAFTRACKFLGIADLRFHDLRHEGISRLFEMGRTIPQAAAVSGHRSWTSLKRYTHIRQSADKYENWKWKVRLACSSTGKH